MLSFASVALAQSGESCQAPQDPTLENPAFAGFAMEELKKLTENETGISKRG